MGLNTDRIKVQGVPVNVGGLVVSNPPDNMCRVVNLYVDPIHDKLVADWDDEVGVAADTITTNPPQGMRRVLNMYVDPATERLIYTYEED